MALSLVIKIRMLKALKISWEQVLEPHCHCGGSWSHLKFLIKLLMIKSFCQNNSAQRLEKSSSP